MITICAYDVNNSSYIIQNGRENVDARRKTLAEKARFEYHRTPKNMCCILFTSNAITPYIESHNVSLWLLPISRRREHIGWNIYGFVLFSEALKSFCLRDRGRLGNRGRPIGLKFGTLSYYGDLCNMPKFQLHCSYFG